MVGRSFKTLFPINSLELPVHIHSINQRLFNCEIGCYILPDSVSGKFSGDTVSITVQRVLSKVNFCLKSNVLKM